jgi:uncharacterized protein
VRSKRFFVDPETALFFEADDVSVDVLEWVRGGKEAAAEEALIMNHGRAAVLEAMGELSLLFAPAPDAPPSEPEPGPIVSLALNVTSECNLACDYCYLGGALGSEPDRCSRGHHPASAANGPMTERTAFDAIELLMEEAGPGGNASLIFFGGEPLLEPALLTSIASRARERASARGVGLSMHVTTNGTLLEEPIALELNEQGVSVMVSIDGPPEVQDAHRVRRDGSGSHAAIAMNLGALPEGLSVSARVTVTEESSTLVDIVSHLEAMGFRTVYLAPVSGGELGSAFTARLEWELEELAAWELSSLASGGRPVVGNFSRAMGTLASGRVRSMPCGAGLRYLCVASDGRLYVCHRFAGRRRFEVGAVDTGVDRDAAIRCVERLRRKAKPCSTCWARLLCGGPCLHDLWVGEDGVDPNRCRVTLRSLELAMWVYASLPEDAKRGFLSRSGRSVVGRGGEGRETHQTSQLPAGGRGRESGAGAG